MLAPSNFEGNSIISVFLIFHFGPPENRVPLNPVVNHSVQVQKGRVFFVFPPASTPADTTKGHKTLQPIQTNLFGGLVGLGRKRQSHSVTGLE